MWGRAGEMSETQDKLNWLAFRYVANELDAAEVSEFESQLLTDQAAREAVAVAVEQATRIRRALSSGVVVAAAAQRSNWGRKSTRVAIVVLGSSLSLLLSVCLVQTSRPVADGVFSESLVGPSTDASAQLAFAWAEARHGLTELKPAAHVALTDSFEGVLAVATDSDFEQSLVPPSWMLAALGTLDSGNDSEFEVE